MSVTKKIIDSFSVRDSLNPKVWENPKDPNKAMMVPKVRKALLRIAEEFIDYLGEEIFVDDIVLTGSLANFNWSEYSDFDLHIHIDLKQFGKDSDLYKELFDLKKFIFNERHNIKIYGYDDELYAQDVEEPHVASGVFSVMNDEWLTKPKKVNFEDCQSKEEIIVAMAKDFGLEVKANTSRERLFEIALSLAVNQGIIPIGTPIEWVDRLLNETIAASRRLMDYNPRMGKFDMVYFSAELDDLTPDSLERRLAWEKYCRSVFYFPIQESHMRILDMAPSSIIAKFIDSYIKNNN